MQQKGQFILFNRDEFKDWLNKTQFKRRILLLQNHNTASPAYKDFKDNHFELCENMKKYHVADRGFQDIAQNITTFPDGKIMVCRSFELDPAGITGANDGGLCMEHLGWFDTGHDKMTDEHKKTIVFLNAILCIKFSLAPLATAIVYHAWYNRDTGKRDNEGANKQGNYKTCPGTAFFGGNSVTAMTKNFLPLVVKEIENIKNPTMTINEAIDILSGLKNGNITVISDPQKWKTNMQQGKVKIDEIQALILKFAQYERTKG